MFKSSLVAKQDSASDSDVLEITPEVIEISLVEDEPLSAAAPFTDEHAEKSSEVIVDTPPPVLSSPPPASSRILFSSGASSAPSPAAAAPVSFSRCRRSVVGSSNSVLPWDCHRIGILA